MTTKERSALLRKLTRVSMAASRAFGLPCHAIRGCFYRGPHDCMACCNDCGDISIRIEHSVTRRQLSWSSLVDSLLHELAHLLDMTHGGRWRSMRTALRAWARQNNALIEKIGGEG